MMMQKTALLSQPLGLWRMHVARKLGIITTPTLKAGKSSHTLGKVAGCSKQDDKEGAQRMVLCCRIHELVFYPDIEYDSCPTPKRAGQHQKGYENSTHKHRKVGKKATLYLHEIGAVPGHQG